MFLFVSLSETVYSFFFFYKCFESSYKGQQTKTRSDPKKRLIGLFTQNPGSFMLSYAKLPQQE